MDTTCSPHADQDIARTIAAVRALTDLLDTYGAQLPPMARWEIEDGLVRGQFGDRGDSAVSILRQTHRLCGGTLAVRQRPGGRRYLSARFTWKQHRFELWLASTR
ncbi:hypothetical protein [Streptantibioticus ferralitis]